MKLEITKSTVEAIKVSSIQLKDYLITKISEILNFNLRLNRRLSFISVLGVLVSGCSFGGNVDVNWKGNAYLNTVTPTSTSFPKDIRTPRPTPTIASTLTPTPTSHPNIPYVIEVMENGALLTSDTLTGLNSRPSCDLVPFAIEKGKFKFLDYLPNSQEWEISQVESTEERIVFLVTDAQEAIKSLIIRSAGKFRIPNETITMMTPLFPDQTTLLGTIPDSQSLWWFALQSLQTGEIELHSQLGLQISPKVDQNYYFSDTENNRGLICFTDGDALKFAFLQSFTLIQDGKTNSIPVQSFESLNVVVTQ